MTHFEINNADDGITSGGAGRMSASLVNLTPHAICVDDLLGDACTIPPSGLVARVETSQEDLCGVVIGGVDVSFGEISTGEVVNLPPPVAGTTYIVSAMVAQAVAGRRLDVYAPDTGQAARDEQGRIISVPGLVRYAAQAAQVG